LVFFVIVCVRSEEKELISDFRKLANCMKYDILASTRTTIRSITTTSRQTWQSESPLFGRNSPSEHNALFEKTPLNTFQAGLIDKK